MIDPLDVRIEVFRHAAMTNVSEPETFPAVRLTHLVTGIVVTDNSTPLSILNKNRAWDELELRVEESNRADV